MQKDIACSGMMPNPFLVVLGRIDTGNPVQVWKRMSWNGEGWLDSFGNLIVYPPTHWRKLETYEL